MAHRFYNLKGKIRYRLKARHHHGFGIHSPYLFHLITSVLQEQYPYYYFGGIESLRKELYTKPVSSGGENLSPAIPAKKTQDADKSFFAS